MKWAGGKRQLLPELRRFYPSTFNRYIEPFFGSGAVFFDLHNAGRLRGHEAILIDSNPDLIGCYETVRDAPGEVAAELKALADARARDPRAHYFTVRDRRFNPARKSGRQSTNRIAYTPALAAMFIYLNRTGFNGLFRVNARGAFNVPPGRYEKPRLVSRDDLERVAAALAAPGVSLRCGPFDLAVDAAENGDFLYFDPPYAPLSRTASFTSYTAERFGLDDQKRLQEAVIRLAGRGCHVLVSNSSAATIADLYERDAAARAAHLATHRVQARRAINSNASARGPVVEYLVTNVGSEESDGESEKAERNLPRIRHRRNI